MNVVGLPMLEAQDSELAAEAVALYQSVALKCLLQHGG